MKKGNYINYVRQHSFTKNDLWKEENICEIKTQII